MNQKFKVTGMGCSACVAAVEKAVKSLDGISNVSVSLIENAMVVEFDETKLSNKEIIEAVKKAGYGADTEAEGKEKKEKKEKSVLMTRFLPSVIFLIPLVIFNLLFKSRLSGCFQCVVSLAILIINRTFFVKGFKSIIHRAPGMDALISIGAGISFIYSVYVLISGVSGMYFFESAGMIFTLITLGKALETNSKSHTMDAIKAMADLMPDTVTVIRENEERIITYEAIREKDVLVIKAGNSIPVDGTVIKGTGAVDKSAITGESLPEEIKEGDDVVSGSMCVDGYFLVEAQKVGNETVLYGIIDTVKRAAIEKTPIERTADKISGVFVPIVLLISVITFVGWMISGSDINFALKMAISVIVISCPCSLGLATPTAIMAGTGNAASHGILIRSGECLETAKNVTTVLLDKTGTVTEGELSVTNVMAVSEIPIEENMLMAAVLEAASDHPYAKAIRMEALKYVSAKEIMNHEIFNVKSIQGEGLKGVINEKPYCIGNEKLMNEEGISVEAFTNEIARFREAGKTVLFLASDKVDALFAVADKIRPDSKEAVSMLSKAGKKIVLLTGDNEKSAEAIAKEAGIPIVISDVLPDEKHEKVSVLIENGENVAMVGDGINDAAALMKANIGIAVGNGTKIAIDSADFILMKNSLKDVAYIFELSKRTMRVIKQNLFWALFYNCIGIPIAAGVFVNSLGLSLSPAIAAGCMSISSLFVVTNALRLRK